MKIDFIASNQGLSLGSYRIWVRDLSNTLTELGHDSLIHPDISHAREDSVIILAKSDYQRVDYKALQGRIVGAINISRDHGDFPLDFVIVGSPEEKISLLEKYENVFIVNLYERMYEKSIGKEHQQKDAINIGYHGSYIHLSKLAQGFVQAFKKLSQDFDLHFTTITNNSKISDEMLSLLGLAQDSFTSKGWDFESVVEDIKEFDIGIVPNIIDQTLISPEIRKQNFINNGINTTDFVYRFKNKSNPGRPFVFYQLGIPVIADLTPSNMPMLFDEECGYIAHCPNSWYYTLKRLTNFEERNRVSKAALDRFRSLYDPHKDAEKLIENIKNILENR
tara:strand:- start:2413 stop:3417 length:1005 start_codon:yes stop_codon:yes gene_type:complete